MRIGFGLDVHKLVEDRKLILGGVEIPHDKGLLGHSDADVLIHAIMDSICGALCLGDIGKLFPDTDMKYKDIDSRVLLRKVFEIMDDMGYEVGNIDSTISCQKPKLRDYIDTMRENIAQDLHTNTFNISVKATTTEKLGFEGRCEGITANSVCILNKKAL
ncbi:2-C-methyl-D-erythritol 2,4-cyclodiphosphate synthase [Finegoldia magna]|uniref:2-C-methyl-D-erythritol 2,4-cyclodiphosphate synthase n=1 Tax=Finegoldia TaxID=150022 RepID=UPI000B915B2B|nr:2-C-methyl-D-erythritol 2,4-cyclodiphosphate synthase [Finegoldia magna]MDU7384603.1 2-C-methyl-D-erythritol 2,4-cyclodiphosphate synthase [Finegoldia magna]OXZ25136.1 2-C-methyl-D-erythritol 2,4-cyclodiphosphate synthase [Finegoldia magna]